MKSEKRGENFGQNARERYKVFLDTSAVLSGLNSPFGASGVLLSLFKLGTLNVVISPEVIDEANQVIARKFPLLKIQFADFLASQPHLTRRVSTGAIRRAYALLPTEDAPILAGAIASRADFLITLDKNFEKVATRNKAPLPVISPGEFLAKHRGVLFNSDLKNLNS